MHSTVTRSEHLMNRQTQKMSEKITARLVIALAASVCWLSHAQRSALADVPASQPATTTAPTPTTQPTSPQALAVLDRLEARGKEIKSLETTILYQKKDLALESVQKYGGILRYLKGQPNPRFFIRFDRMKHDNIESQLKKWHVFDGRWYIEANERTRQIVKREIVPPGRKLDGFNVGDSPFPLLLGPQKDEILKNFAVEFVPATEKEKHTDHLRCTPLPGTEMAKRYTSIDIYVDREKHLPVRVHTIDNEEFSEVEVIFPRKNIRLNAELKVEQLELPEQELLDRGFEVQNIYLDNEPPAAPMNP